MVARSSASPSTAVAAALEKAEALLARIDESAETDAAAGEPELFPHGVPVPLTTYAFRAAQIEYVVAGADALVQKDLVVGALERQVHPEIPRASLLSMPVAGRVLKADALKAWWAREGADEALELEAVLFPNGEGRWLGLVDMVRAFRVELMRAITQTRADLEKATEDDPEARAFDAEYLETMAEKGAWFLQGIAVAAAAARRRQPDERPAGSRPAAYGDA